MKKSRVKELASQRFQGLNVLTKKESTGVCFIGKRMMPSFLQQYITLSSGQFIDIDTGKVLGEHRGKELYTLGQKAKIGSQKQKYFVASKSRDSNDILVATGPLHPSLYDNEVFTSLADFSWVSGQPPPQLMNSGALKLSCKARYRDPMSSCEVALDRTKARIHVKFEHPVKSIAPGQVVALYDGEECLGGGFVLEKVNTCNHE